MDVAVSALVPLGVAMQALRRARRVKMVTAVDALTEAKTATSAARILFELNPNRLNDLCAANRCLNDPEQTLVSETMEAIGEIAPLDTDMMDVEFQDDGQVPWLLPAPAGFALGWEEWEEWSGHLDEHADAKMYIFWTCIRLGESETLESAGWAYDWLDWGMEIPDLYTDEEEHMDWERFEETLRNKGLGCFIAAREICCYDTGNPYFDWNPYDENGESQSPAVPFNLEGVRELEKDWQAAQPMLEDFREARERFDRDPSLAGKLLAIWDSCMVRNKKKRKRRARARTLVEVFREEVTRGRLIDPFYGPLDGGEGDAEDGLDDD
jgi:hypothetical protein